MTRIEQAEAMARRLLWLAYCWNDHNFDAAHIEARREAEQHDIRSFDEANAWLASNGASGIDWGYTEAFYEIAAMLGIKGARAKSPEEVYEDEVKPALEILIACAIEPEPEVKECRHCDRRAASWGVMRPSSFHYPDCPTAGVDLPHGGQRNG